MATENEPANPDQARRVARIRAEIAEARAEYRRLFDAGLSAPTDERSKRMEFLRGELVKSVAAVAEPYQLTILHTGLQCDRENSTQDHICHEHLSAIAPVLETDYTDYGGRVERWEDPRAGYPDCSCGCKWAAWLEDKPTDWCVCCKPGAPRCGLLTFEHQAGHGCFEAEQEEEDEYQ